MNNVNYVETIIVPTLQKKIQDLQNSNLVLEVNLLIEQNKNKDLINKYQNDIVNNSTKDEIIISLKEKIKLFEDIQKQLEREKSLKENAISEYNILKQQYDELNRTISIKKDKYKKPQDIV